MAVSVGDRVPDFELIDQNKERRGSADISGKKALVVFIPFPFTDVCEGEVCQIRDNLTDLNEMDAAVVVITCDTRPVNAHWSQENGFGFPVLSDFWPHGEVSRAFGCFNEDLGCANRYTYVVDADGIVTDVINSDSLGVGREFAAYLDALKQI